MSDTAPKPPSPERRNWRSGAVRLVLLGSAGTALAAVLGSCGRVSYHRNVYRDLNDCSADYSSDVCRLKGKDDWGGYLGPVYRMVGDRPAPCNSNDPGEGRTSVPPSFNTATQKAMLRKSVQKIERGGFGTADVSSCDRRARHGYSSRSRRWWSFGG